MARRRPVWCCGSSTGIVSRRVIDFLKENEHHSSLEKLRHEEYRRGHRYSLWNHHPNVRLLTSESMFMQRVHYTHQNPLRLGLVERDEGYRFSSARIWNKRPLDDEPLLVDMGKICWRSRRAAQPQTRLSDFGKAEPYHIGERRSRK